MKTFTAITLLFTSLFSASAAINSYSPALSVVPKQEGQVQASLDILAFGDIMLSRYVRTLMDKHGKDYVFEHLDLSALEEGMDIVFANLEGPIHGQGTSGGEGMVFSFNRDIAPFLKEKGFTLLSLANNHALDQGRNARDETIQVLSENNLGWCGHPTEADEWSVHYGKTATGMSYAFVCFQDVTHKIDLEAAKALIAQVNPTVDIVVVSPHWGQEYQLTNNARQQELAHAFVESGADLIIGHHPHVVQNVEVYQGVPIFYSLGNFVFDQYWDAEPQKELGLKLHITAAEYQIELLPMKSEKSQSRLMTDEEKSVWVEDFLKHGNYDEAMQQMIRQFKIVVKR